MGNTGVNHGPPPDSIFGSSPSLCSSDESQCHLFKTSLSSSSSFIEIIEFNKSFVEKQTSRDVHQVVL